MTYCIYYLLFNNDKVINIIINSLILQIQWLEMLVLQPFFALNFMQYIA